MKISIIIPLAPGTKPKIMKQFSERDFKIITIEGLNTSKNRNRGAVKAKTELVAFINHHSTLSKDWSKNVKDFFRKHPNFDIVGGPQLTPKNSSYFEKLSGYALGSIFGSGGIYKRYSGKGINLNADETMITSANLICKKKVFDKIKFDERIYPGEDPKFISDAKKAGFKIAFDSKIIAFNERRSNLKSFFKQNFKYGFMRTKKESFLDTCKRPFFLVPSLFILYLILLIPLIFVYINFINVLTGYILLFPLFLYLLLGITFSFINSYKNKDYGAFFFLPFIYMLIHISYGSGIIWGYLKKVLK